ncbi:MAG: LytTR family DNA-binding domain-containing protein [Fermentimonas sp.]|nr:LytTR family DNA-binding domain-containing protein [Fermentimonas sp.]
MKTALKDKLSRFLSQPYPFYYKGKSLWMIAVILFVFSFVFNYFFQPFNVNHPEHKMSYLMISVIHSITPFVILLLFSIFRVSPETEERWTVLKEMLLLVILLFIVGIVQFLIRDIIYDNPDNWSWKYFFEEIRNTFLVGSLIVIILISLNFNRLNYWNKKRADEMNLSTIKNNIQSDNKDVDDSGVFIETQVKADDFMLKVDNLLFAKSEGNYIEFYLMDVRGVTDMAVNKFVKRLTLKDLESALEPFPEIIRTHRSYLVNVNQIKGVVGNAQGYKLKLRDYDGTVPVSRNMIGNFNNVMNGN